jgi:hypothetical protein
VSCSWLRKSNFDKEPEGLEEEEDAEVIAVNAAVRNEVCRKDALTMI